MEIACFGIVPMQIHFNLCSCLRSTGKWNQPRSVKRIEVYLCLAFVAAWVWHMNAEMLLKHESPNHILANAYALRPLFIRIYALWNLDRDVPVRMLRVFRNTSESVQCASLSQIDCKWIRMASAPSFPRLRFSEITCLINHGTYFISATIWPNWMRCLWNKNRARRKTMKYP